METDVDGEQEVQDGDETMNECREPQGLLMKNVMRLVVFGSITAIVINFLMVSGRM